MDVETPAEMTEAIQLKVLPLCVCVLCIVQCGVQCGHIGGCK